MSDRVFEGSTVEDALARAAAELDLRVDDLEHEVLGEAADDFWGLDEPQIRVRVWKKGERPAQASAEQEPEEAPEEAPGHPASKQPGQADAAVTPVPDAETEPDSDAEAGDGFWSDGEDEGAEDEEEAEEEPAAAPDEEPDRAEPAPDAGAEVEEFEGLPEEIDDPAPEIRNLLEKVFQDMTFECTCEIEEGEETIDVVISGADKDYLVESGGKGLSALELILNHSFRHRLPRGRKIRVDAGDFRSRREQELRDLAFQVAHSAKESGETQETHELNPYERRLVHLALADDDDVTTRSRGNGFLKHVQVIPSRQGGGRGR